MSQLYFLTFEPVFRILHIPSYLRDLEASCEHPSSAMTLRRTKVNIVVALGCSANSSIDEHMRALACQSIHDAQMWLGGPSEKDRLTIDGLSIWCLVVLARQALCVGGDLISIGMGGLVRMAMHLGLHRDPRHFPSMTTL